MAVCAGPPDTIAMGCPTVLIGEISGGGGGAGMGGSITSGSVLSVAGADIAETAGSSVVNAAALGMAVAASGGKPSGPEKPETHWVEFDFIDTAGNPVSGVPYDFTGTDGEESSGSLNSEGKIRRDGVPAGTAKVKLYSLTNAEWSKDEAEAGDTVGLKAEVEGFESGTPATITIYERDTHGGDDLVEVLEAEVGGGRVEVDWEYRLVEEDETSAPEQSDRYSYPEYYFTVRVGRCQAVSGLLFFKDWVEVELKDQDDQAVPDCEYRVVLPNGEVRTGTLDGQGKAKLENMPPGKVKVDFIGLQERKRSAG
jgi:hypothetical protein